MNEWTYLWVNLGVVFVPFVASFDKRVAFFKEWKAFWPACLLTMVFFISWDVIFTSRGIWGFNSAHLTGVDLLNLPVEEWLFFITVPYACVFTYACFKKYIPKSPLGFAHRGITLGMTGLCLGIALGFYDKDYLGLTAALCTIWLFGTLLRWRAWMGHFWFAYFVLLLPFVISNGVLTGLDFWSYPFLHNNPESIVDHIVWYNNEENSGWRLFSMPVDDLLYGLLLIGVNVSLFEAFSKRDSSSVQIHA